MASTEARLLDAIRSQVNSFDTRVAALGDVRKEAEAEVTRLTPTEAEEVRLNEQVEAMRAVGGQLRAELQRTRLAQAADIGQVEIVDRARRALPIGRGRPLKLALGILLGLLVGTAIAVLRNYLNTGLHSRTDVDEVLRVPGLVVIPQLPRGAQPRPFFAARLDAAFGTRAPRDSIRHGAANGRGVIQPELVTISNATNSASGAYRALRTRLLFGPNSGAALRRVVVTSAWSGEGKTTTAANLAVTLAQQGMRVLLVDCDLRQPRLHVLFGLRNPVGLTDVLLGRRTLEDHVVQPSGVERLSLLTSGPTDAGAVGASELLGGQRMTKLLTTVLEHFDVTVLDTPPVLLAPDASILAARADGTLLVLYAGRTGRSLAQDAVQQLVAVGANVVGAVLNDPDGRTAQYQEYVR
jgi:tyrosine-protein kinase Etk/Wzc